MAGFYDSIVQVIIIGFLAFAGPGLFNALNGLGAAGSGDPIVAAAANGTLYGFFAVVGYFSSVFFNMMGPKLCLGIGGATFAVYAICMYYSTAGVWVAALGGAILGCGAGIFWTAQSALMLSYATEHEKGKFTGIFWAIFNLGAMFGGFLQMGLNWSYFEAESGGVYTVSGAVASPVAYWTFIILMLIGSLTAFVVLAPPKMVIKSDGTSPVLEDCGSAKEEFKAAFIAIKDPFVWKMFLYFFYSNWYYTFEFGAMTGFMLNSRSAGLNSALYRLMNMGGAQILGLIGDNKKWTLKKRAHMTFFTTCGLFLFNWTLAIACMYTTCNGLVDKELTITNEKLATFALEDMKVFKLDGGSWVVDIAADTVGGFHLNRLAWFPPHQVSVIPGDNGKIIEDGCEWLKLTKEYYHAIAKEECEYIFPASECDDMKIREACISLNVAYDIEKLNAVCLYDIYECVDGRNGDQFGRGMMDIVQSDNAPLCDLAQTNLCTSFNAEFLGEQLLPMITNVFNGLTDAFFQTYVFWLIGVRAGSSIKLSVKYAACFKGIQSLGASISWLSDLSPSFLYRYQAIFNIVLGAFSLAGSFAAIKEVLDNAHNPNHEAPHNHGEHLSHKELSSRSSSDSV